jgi:hypothetical protein
MANDHFADISKMIELPKAKRDAEEELLGVATVKEYLIVREEGSRRL